MGRRNKVSGKCRLCGLLGPLSYEHVPPEAAFNDGKYYYTAKMEEILKLGDSNYEILSLANKSHAKKKQRGIGFYTLCEKCNNTTGSWYGNSFVHWVYQAMAIILKANKNPTLYYPTYIFPLRIIKQVLTMFFSVKHEEFGDNNPALRKFILNRDFQYLPEEIKIYCYYNIEGANRYIGDNVVGSLNNMSPILLSEITFPPMGFVLTVKSRSPDERLTEISHFANYRYNDWIDHHQKFATLPTHLPFFAGDYRTKKEIQEGMQEAQKFKQGG